MDKHENPMTVPSPELIERLKKIDSATVSNAIEQFEVRDRAAGFADYELRCQFPNYEPLVGYAVTCVANTTSPGEQRPSQMNALWDLVHAAPKPAVVVVQYQGHDRKRSCFFGDMSATGLYRLGAVGVVTDGSNRDKAGIASRAPGFHVFSPGWVVSHGRGAFLEFDLNVSVCGLDIAPGDLLHGDANGLLTIPHEIAEQVPDMAEKVLSGEQGYFDYLAGDSFSYDEWKRRLETH